MNRSQDAALGTGHLVALATGGVIGLGVMSMPGIGIGIIGTGLWIAALVGLGFSVIALVPQLLLNSSGECPGGQYQQLRDTVGRYVGGVGAYLLCFLVFDIAAYALSAAQLLPVPPLDGAQMLTSAAQLRAQKKSARNDCKNLHFRVK